MAHPVQSFIPGLSNDIAEQVFEYVDLSQLEKARAVSRAWHSIDIGQIQQKRSEDQIDRMLLSIGVRRLTAAELTEQRRLLAQHPISDEEMARLEEASYL